MSDLSTEEKRAEVEAFIRAAFVVDGTVETVFRDVHLTHHPCIDIVDAKRGKFTVILHSTTEGDR